MIGMSKILLGSYLSDHALPEAGREFQSETSRLRTEIAQCVWIGTVCSTSHHKILADFAPSIRFHHSSCSENS
jgi:hypothetical protein